MDLTPAQSLNLTTGALAERVLRPGMLLYTRTDDVPTQVWEGPNQSDPRTGIPEKGRYLGTFKGLVRNSAGQAFLAQLNYTKPRYVPLTQLAVQRSAALAVLPSSEAANFKAMLEAIELDQLNYQQLNLNRYLVQQLQAMGVPASRYSTVSQRTESLASRYNARQQSMANSGIFANLSRITSGLWEEFKKLVGIGFLPLLAPLGWAGTLAVGALTAAGVVYLGSILWRSLFGEAQSDNVQLMDDYTYLYNQLPQEAKSKFRQFVQAATDQASKSQGGLLSGVGDALGMLVLVGGGLYFLPKLLK